VTDAELVCLAVAQVLLRYDDERHWLRAAAMHVGHLFPRLLGQSEYNNRVKAAAPLMEAALRWLADHTPACRKNRRELASRISASVALRSRLARSGSVMPKTAAMMIPSAISCDLIGIRRRPRLQQQHRNRRVLGQPGREHAPGAPAADDNIIEFIQITHANLLLLRSPGSLRGRSLSLCVGVFAASGAPKCSLDCRR
jgi:hypothetical protein